MKKSSNKKVVIIGGGFSGLSGACFLAKAGFEVVVLEKNKTPGGRARQLKANGFTFDMGPSWYWMPDIFERFFKHFGKKVSDYYQLQRLDPSYRVYWENEFMDIPADYESLKLLFESIETGSGDRLDRFMGEAGYKYKFGMQKLVYKPGLSPAELIDIKVMLGVLRLDIFTSMQKHLNKYFKSPRLRQLMEFPTLFLGAMAKNTPALYSLMNYADIKLGTWYPEGGIYKIVEAMAGLAQSLGVKFYFDTEVTGVNIIARQIRSVTTGQGDFESGIVLGTADYHYIETALLPEKYRSYDQKYWDHRVMAPSCLVYYLGLDKRLENIQHHNLFFDASFDQHAVEIYTNPSWPEHPLFYVSCTSRTDPTVSPAGCENLFILIPVASGLSGDTEAIRERYFEQIIQRIELYLKQSVKEHVIYKKSYAHSNFIKDYHAFRGNAYGLANTLPQTANLKPSVKNKRLNNLYFAGQLTVPGPGVPPAIISGEVAAREIIKACKLSA